MSLSSSMGSCLCSGEIPPEIFQAFGTTEERSEMGRIDQQKVSCTITGRRHPQKTVHFGVARRHERMRPIGIDRLACEHMYFGAVRLIHFIVRQVWMKIQRGNVLKKPEFIQIAKGGERRNISGSRDNCRTEAPFVDDRNVQRFHQRTRELAEPLLPWNQIVAVMEIFHLALFEIVGKTDVVMRRNEKTCAFALQPSVYRFDLAGIHLEIAKQMIQSKNQQCVCVVEYPFIDRLVISRLVDTLKYGDGMTGQLPRD